MSPKDTQSNMKQQIEDVIKRNLPEKMKWQGGEAELHIQIADGFNKALSQINTSLIADEVLKVVVEKIKEIKPPQFAVDIQSEKGKEIQGDCSIGFYRAKDIVLQLLSNLSPIKENK